MRLKALRTDEVTRGELATEEEGQGLNPGPPSAMRSDQTTHPSRPHGSEH